MPSEDSRAGRNFFLQPALMLLWLTLLVGMALYGLQPPDARPASAPAEVFSAERALIHVRALAARPHPLGAPAHDQARDYLVSQLTQLGLSPHIQTTPVVASGWNRPYRAATISNVWVRLPGRAGAGTLLLAAHYDSVPTAPGASDDAASAAGLLEAARALQAQRQTHAALRNDIVLLFTDGEEAGLLGARAFTEQHFLSPPSIALNFEARGAGGPSLMFETGAENGWLVRRFAHAAPQPAASSLFYAVYKILPNDTDFTEFRNAGMRGLNFAFIDKISHYHTALDNTARLDARSLQQQGDNMLALALDLGDAPLGKSAQPDATYFNVTRSRIAIYPEAWAVPLAVCATLLTLLSLGMTLRTGRITLLRIAACFLWMLAALVLTATAGTLLTRLLSVLAPSPRSILHLGNSVLAGVILLALGLAWSVLAQCEQRMSANSQLSYQPIPDRVNFMAEGVTAGAILWWLLLTWLTALKLPGGSHLFAWPLLFALAANLAARAWLSRTALAFPRTRTRTTKPEQTGTEAEDEEGQTVQEAANVINADVWPSIFLAQMIGAIPAMLLVVPVLCLLFSALAVTDLPIIALLAALTIGLLYPQFALVARLVPARPFALPLLTASAGIGLIVAGATAMRPTAAYPQFDSLFYALDADREGAIWASDDTRPDVWTKQFLGANPQRNRLSAFLPVSVNVFLNAPAPVLPLAPPTITLVTETGSKESGEEENGGGENRLKGNSKGENSRGENNPGKGGVRVLRLRVVSPRHAPLVEVAVEEAEVAEAKVEGKAVGGNSGTGHDWSLLYFNLPPKGITLMLRVKAASDMPIVLRAVDRSYGLPVMPDADLPALPYTPRPDFILSSPAAGWYQDATLVSKTYRF